MEENSTSHAAGHLRAQIIDDLPDGILIVNLEGKILSANKAAHSLFSKKGNELIGTIYPFPVDTSQIEKIEISRQGELYYIESLANLINWEGQDVHTVSLRDVTKNIRKENSGGEAGEARDKRTEFISVVSHEFKTPLTCLKAYNELVNISIEEKNYQEAKLYSGKINTFVNRLTNITNDLLEASRIQSGQIKYNLEVIDVQNLITDTIKHLASLTPSHKITLKGKVSASIKADKRKVEQVLFNLVNNAVIYSPSADQVIVSVSLSAKNVQIKIQDFGIGITEQNLQNIFYMFYRSERVVNKFQGLGLGLFIAAQIIKAHKGQLHVESEMNKGSVFSFTLPLSLKQSEQLN